MKYLKKFASIALALVMVLALAAPAFADEGKTGSITVTNPTVGETYTIYKLFDLSYGGGGVPNEPSENETPSTDPHTYSIDPDSPWYDFVTGDGAGTVYVEVDDQNYVTWIEGKSAADFAKAAMTYAKENDIANQGSMPAAANTEVKFADLPLGYYLIDSTLGALCALDSTNYNANVKEKNELPTLDKTIESIENKTGTVAPAKTDGSVPAGKSGTAFYGSTVTFKIAVTVPSDAEGTMIVHDFMDKQLTYVDDSAKLGTTTIERTDPDEEDTYLPNGATLEKYTHHDFVIDADTVATNRGNTITITYEATLNVNVATATAIKNIANLSYSKYKTPDSNVDVYTYEFEVVKTDNSAKILSGATFKLYDATTGGNEILLVEDEIGTYHVATPEEIAAAEEDEDYEFATITAGKAAIKGLSAGTYYLEEITPPAGYNRLTERKDVIISNDNVKATATDTTYQSGGVQVINNAGTELPSTGGIGTTIFYVVGGVLVLGAAVVLITKRRAGADDE